jgi:hypothetical protein
MTAGPPGASSYLAPDVDTGMTGARRELINGPQGDTMRIPVDELAVIQASARP